LDTRLSQWRSAVAGGWLPATIFNATVKESGEPMLLSTVDVNPSANRRVFGSGPGSYDGADISVVTAARLSATFPYVSPAATACYKNTSSQRGCLQGFDEAIDHPHFVDGGYADAFGVDSAVAWLEPTLNNYSDRLGGAIIIQVRAFPETTSPVNTNDPLSFLARWLDGAIGPPATLLAIRSSLQLKVRTLDLDQIRSHFRPGFVNTFVLEALHEGPLSWRLSESQKRSIECDWRDPRTQGVIEQLRAAVPGIASPAQPKLTACATNE